MRRLCYLALLGSVLCCGAACGCRSTPADTAAFAAIRTSWELIGPQYKGYVAGDSALSNDMRMQRIELADDLTKLLGEAGK